MTDERASQMAEPFYCPIKEKLYRFAHKAA